jgi:sialidase-1
MSRSAALTALALLAVPATAEPIKTDLFEAGTGGYAIYRIPGVVVTPKGSVLFYCEARTSARGDGPHVCGCWALDLVLGKS